MPDLPKLSDPNRPAPVSVAYALMGHLLRHPRQGWAAIGRAPLTVHTLIAGLAAPLVALASFAAFYGITQVGVPTPEGEWQRTPVERGLLGLGASLALSLASVWVMALLIEALAPRFEATADRTTAVKLAVYSQTPTWLVGLALAYPPALPVLSLGLYSLYLFWTGARALTAPPAERHAPFALSVVGIMFALSLVVAAVSAPS